MDKIQLNTLGRHLSNALRAIKRALQNRAEAAEIYEALADVRDVATIDGARANARVVTVRTP